MRFPQGELGNGNAPTAETFRPRERANPVPDNVQTGSAPIRASAPLIEQFYVAVDRQLKSGYGTYDAAEKAAQEIKKTSNSTSNRL
jgi:hypothetical protein